MVRRMAFSVMKEYMMSSTTVHLEKQTEAATSRMTTRAVNGSAWMATRLPVPTILRNYDRSVLPVQSVRNVFLHVPQPQFLFTVLKRKWTAFLIKAMTTN
jgi:hypothetical protein